MGRRSGVLAALLLAAASLARAGEDDPAMAKARAAYAAWRKTAQGPAEEDPGDSDAMRRFKRSGPTVADLNRASFGSAFAKTDFDAWDPDADRDLLREGLLLTVRRETRNGRAEVAVRAGDLFLARFPDHEAAADIRGYDLPAALLVAGDVARALELARTHAAKLSGIRGARALLLLGDLETVAGPGAAAGAAYDRAFGLTSDPDADGPVDIREADWEELGRRSENRVVRAEIAARRDRAGQRLAKLRHGGIGPVRDVVARGSHHVVLWFFSPSEEDDLAVLRRLDRLAREVGGDRLRVAGVTWFENLASTRYLKDAPPDGRWMLDAQGERTIVAPLQLERRLAELREGLDLAAPLAVLLEQRAHEWVGKEGRRLLLVADADHRVVFASRAAELPLTPALVAAIAKAAGPAGD